MAEETHQEQPPHLHQDKERHVQDRHNPQPRPAQEQRPQEPAGDNLDAAEDEEEHAESRHRSHGGGHRGGRPVKKVYEEWANDPYCE